MQTTTLTAIGECIADALAAFHDNRHDPSFVAVMGDVLSRTLGNRRSAERLYGRINVHVACTIASELNLAERAIKELDRECGRLLTQLNSDIAAGLAQSTSLETQTRRKEITIKSRGWFALEQALAAARLQIAEAI